MKIWEDNEVKALFENVEKCKAEQSSLVQAFAEHAKKFARKPNSVRNYYYHEVDNLLADKSRLARLRIDITKHKKTHFKNFDKIQEADLFGEIDKLTAKGFSVRGACLKLSGGDIPLMTRYQNKYQNMKRKIEQNTNFQKNGQKRPNLAQKNAKNAQISQNLQKFVKIDESFVAPQDGAKIIPFKAFRRVSDADINSLFLGLVRLIRKTAEEENAEILTEMNQKLIKKEKEFSALKEENSKLKKEKNSLLEQLSFHENKKLALERHLQKNRLEEKSNLQTPKRG